MASLLWNDGDQKQDEALVNFLVNKIVSGPDDHKKSCTKKILEHIATDEWQQRYRYKYFVFCIYYSINMSLVEISYGLSVQAIESLYFLFTKDTSDTNLADKIRHVFKQVYGHSMPYESADALRVLRNNVMHTGGVFGFEEVSQKNKAIVDRFCEKFMPIDQIMTQSQQLISLAGAFDYLTKDTVIRVLGLEWDDLLYNGNPPSKLNYFCNDNSRKVFKDTSKI